MSSVHSKYKKQSQSMFKVLSLLNRTILAKEKKQELRPGFKVNGQFWVHSEDGVRRCGI